MVTHDFGCVKHEGPVKLFTPKHSRKEGNKVFKAIGFQNSSMMFTINESSPRFVFAKFHSTGFFMHRKVRPVDPMHLRAHWLLELSLYVLNKLLPSGSL